MKFKAGQRVILIDKSYIPTSYCPVWGTHKASVGTILTTTSNIATIQWDNGVASNHFFKSLTLHNEGKIEPNVSGEVEPNRAFLLKKMGMGVR